MREWHGPEPAPSTHYPVTRQLNFCENASAIKTALDDQIVKTFAKKIVKHKKEALVLLLSGENAWTTIHRLLGVSVEPTLSSAEAQLSCSLHQIKQQGPC